MTDARLIHPSNLPEVHEELIDLMLLQLSWLSYHALEQCVQRLLINLGYQEVSILSRTFLRGRTNHGGVDLLAKSQTPLGLLPAVVQVKRVATPVARASVDQLRGAMLRHAAPHGLLITTNTFADPALEAAESFLGRPIRLIDGLELARLLVDARVGVRDCLNTKTGERSLEFMPELFEMLERNAEAQRRGLDGDICGGA